MNVIDLRARLREPTTVHPLDPGRPLAGPPPSLEGSAGIEIVEYQTVEVHEAVPLVQLVSVLRRGGFTVSTVSNRIVIHRVGDHPERPSKPIPTP